MGSYRPKFHAVVFSQFTSFLDLVEDGLKAAKLRSVRLDGSMSRKEREASVRQFHDKTRHCVFVISLKAGGTGLNLVGEILGACTVRDALTHASLQTLANRIYLLDFWWNRAIEDQAVDRVHRFGQQREVRDCLGCSALLVKLIDGQLGIGASIPDKEIGGSWHAQATEQEDKGNRCLSGWNGQRLNAGTV